jgi:hypothetical protein
MSTEVYLTRQQAFEFLQARGLPMSKSTFERVSAPGSSTGPRVARWWNAGGSNRRGRPLYTQDDLEAWIEARNLVLATTPEA